jgi:hypothetical protein
VTETGVTGWTWPAVKKAYQDFWKRKMKPGKGDYRKVALYAAGTNRFKKGNGTQKKKPWKMFKGTCNHCGKQGHKAADCFSKEAGDSGGKGKRSGKCFNCGKLGHFAHECPKKNEEKNRDSSWQWQRR